MGTNPEFERDSLYRLILATNYLGRLAFLAFFFFFDTPVPFPAETFLRQGDADPDDSVGAPTTEQEEPVETEASLFFREVEGVAFAMVPSFFFLLFNLAMPLFSRRGEVGREAGLDVDLVSFFFTGRDACFSCWR